MKLTDNTILITGGGSGIGRGLRNNAGPSEGPFVTQFNDMMTSGPTS